MAAPHCGSSKYSNIQIFISVSLTPFAMVYGGYMGEHTLLSTVRPMSHI